MQEGEEEEEVVDTLGKVVTVTSSIFHEIHQVIIWPIPRNIHKAYPVNTIESIQHSNPDLPNPKVALYNCNA